MGKRLAKRAGIPLFCLLCAGAALLLASTASPLYATNFWTDTNIYFTIGRGLRAGRMPYRDLFDHKGPLLYLLYGLAACVSDGNFLGVFLLETLSLAAFLDLAYRGAKRSGAGPAAPLAIPLSAMAVCGCRAFIQGGSAEEFCLPFLALGIVSAEALMDGGEGDSLPQNAALFGGGCAFVFLVKYTDVGLFAGLFCFAMLSLWRGKGFAAALRAAGWMALGFCALCLPVFGFYALHGALSDCLRVYFLENLFSYGGAPMSLRMHLWNALAYLRTQSAANPPLAALTALGMAGWAASRLARGGRGSLFSALMLPAGALCLLLTCYWGEMAHPYYALVFAATAACGICVLLSLAGRLTGGRGARPAKAVCAALCLALTVFTPFLSAEKPEMRALRGVRREEMPQAVFLGAMRRLTPEGELTLLDLTSLDQGFYLAAGVLPAVRYFADNNLDTEEKRLAISRYLSEAVCEYVVTVWRDPGENYECVLEADGLFDLADARHYRLWRRKEKGKAISSALPGLSRREDL